MRQRCRRNRQSSLRFRVPFFLLLLGCLSLGGCMLSSSAEANLRLTEPSSMGSNGRRLEAVHIRDDDGEESDTCVNYQGRSTGYAVQSFVIFVLLTLWVFVGVAIICDEYFEPCLEIICEKLDLSEDVAGATFMAAGSSAPELFTAIGDVFGTKNSIGIGTIVGSAVFNLVCICGLSSAVTGLALQLDWRPLARDGAFYFTAICVLVGVVFDGEISWYESILMLSGYAGYIAFMFHNQQLLLKLGPPPTASIEDELEDVAHSQIGMSAVATEDDDETEGKADAPPNEIVALNDEPSESCKQIVDKMRSNEDLFNQDEVEQVYNGLKALEERPQNDQEEEEEEEEESPLMTVLGAPYVFAFKWTIPKCDEEEYEKYYLVSFCMCCAWIGALSFAMAYFATAIGCLISMDPGVMGLTLVAAGTSVPDAMASIAVAREGKGNMAVSNAIGSNVFDIFLGLGFPWALSTMIVFREPVNVASKTEGVLIQAFIQLVLTLGALLGTLKWAGWVLTPKIGYFLISMYVLFVIISFASNTGSGA